MQFQHHWKQKLTRKFYVATSAKFCLLIFILAAFFLLSLKSVSSFSPTSAPPPPVLLPHHDFSSSADAGLSNTWPTPPYHTDFFSVCCYIVGASGGPPPTISRFFSLFPTNTWPTGPSPASFWRTLSCPNTIQPGGSLSLLHSASEEKGGRELEVLNQQLGLDQRIIEVGEEQAGSNKHLQHRWESQ